MTRPSSSGSGTFAQGGARLPPTGAADRRTVPPARPLTVCRRGWKTGGPPVLLRRSPHPAFTFIAILAALLLPALSGARRQAKGAVCLSSPRQLQMGWLQHACQDHMMTNGAADGGDLQALEAVRDTGLSRRGCPRVRSEVAVKRHRLRGKAIGPWTEEERNRPTTRKEEGPRPASPLRPPVSARAFSPLLTATSDRTRCPSFFCLRTGFRVTFSSSGTAVLGPSCARSGRGTAGRSRHSARSGFL